MHKVWILYCNRRDSCFFAQEFHRRNSRDERAGGETIRPLWLPGFAALTPSFKQTETALANLPQPVLLRLPADVLFDFDSAQLKTAADPLLSQAIALITKYPQADVHIDGYSDSFGRADYNQALSQQRAQAVEAWLQQRITQNAYTFHSQGHGSSSYIVPATASIDEQQPNRRVEILIQAMKQ